MLEKIKFLAVELECTTIFGSACIVAQMLNKKKLLAPPLQLLSLFISLHFSHPLSIDIFSVFLHLVDPSHLPSPRPTHFPCLTPNHLFLHLPPTKATTLFFSLLFFFLSSSTRCKPNSPAQTPTYLSSSTRYRPKP